jgi:Reverse transcriptase (RNA-dependent DNA polymerase)/Endonuclease-reverse transcriptase/Domain of unknown function (DUF6451)
MNDFRGKLYRLGRRPGEQGPRPLLSDQGRVEKLATGENLSTTKNTHKLTLVKNTLTVGTWNVQTLWAAGKLELLRNEMKRFKYDIIGISEVRWTGKGETPNGDFIWSGEETSHTRGVGFLLSAQAKKALIGYNPISSRIISARFDAAPFKISVIHVYAPTSSSTEEDIEAFYNDVDETITKTEKKDIIILTGDWNAKVGSDNTDWKSVMGKYGFGDRNERGERLLEFATVHDLFICNTRFQQKPNRKWTWASPDGIHKNMIDLILIQRRWKTSVINCRTFQSADISSDHSLVLCNIKLRLKKMYNTSQQRCRVDVSQLKDEKIRQSYSTTLMRNMESIEATCNLEVHANKIRQAIQNATETTVPAKRKAKKPWISEMTIKLADEKRKLKQMKNVSTEYTQRYKDSCRRVKRSARQDKEQWIQDQCEQAEKGLNIGNTREAYSLLKMLRKEFVPRLNVIRDQQGTMLQSKEDIKQRWTEYCSSLYKDPGGGDGTVKELEDISPPDDEGAPDILYSEVQTAIRALKKNKSPGSDGITAEMLQAGGDPLTRQIHMLCNKSWHEGTIPEEWAKSILVPIPKKGDLSNCSNYRTISLINHTGKVLLIVLLNRLKNHLDPYLSEEQAGFRKDRSTIHQILMLRLLAEKAKRQGKKIYNCFIDFQKAFDTIKHKIIWATLKSYGVETKMITLLQNIYEKSQSAVRIGDDYGEWFQTDVGTRQGDPLSPLLFITYLERVMDQVRQNTCGINIGGVMINNLRFADDIDLIDEDVSSLQRQFDLTKSAAEQSGLILNTNKTKTMVFGDRNIERSIRVAGNTIENVEKFEYLGSLITWDNNCSDEIKRQIGKATGALASLKHIWNSKKMKIENKLKILTTCVFSVLLYAAETWTLKEADKKKLLAFEMKCYRRILKINWKDMIRNEDIRKRISKEETIIDIIKKRKLRLFGHICRMDDTRIIKHVIFSKMEGKSRRGRPCREWLDDITEWCQRSGQELYHLAQDRQAWKNLIP